MKRIAIGVLVAFGAISAFAQQQTPDCQDVAYAIGYRSDEPSFTKRTLVAHGRDPDASRINRTPVAITLAEANAKRYPGALIPEFEGGGKRIEPDETQVWEITGKILSRSVNGVNRRGGGSADFRVCDSTSVNCIDVSMSPPECVGDSVFSAEILAVWQKQLLDEINVGSTYTFRGPAYWCCENNIAFNLKPIIDVVPAADNPDDGGEEVPISPPDVSILLPQNIGGQPVVLSGGQSSEFDVTTTSVSSFYGDVQLSVWTDAQPGDNFSVTVSPSFIPSPGRGTAQIRINTTPTTFPRDYLVTISALANGKTFNTSFVVKVGCDPPAVLGIDQPRDVTANPGVRGTFRVKPLGTGPFQYQWYRGRRGSAVFPIANATTDTLEVTSVDDVNMYWVRVSNNCGTVDSTTVSIAPSHRRAVRR